MNSFIFDSKKPDDNFEEKTLFRKKKISKNTEHEVDDGIMIENHHTPLYFFSRIYSISDHYCPQTMKTY